jgi:hypothetical protein
MSINAKCKTENSKCRIEPRESRESTPMIEVPFQFVRIRAIRGPRFISNSVFSVLHFALIFESLALLSGPDSP